MRVGRTHGVTLLELLVALAITITFLGGAILAFVEILRSGERS